MRRESFVLFIHQVKVRFTATVWSLKNLKTGLPFQNDTFSGHRSSIPHAHCCEAHKPHDTNTAGEDRDREGETAQPTSMSSGRRLMVRSQSRKWG